MDQIKFKLKTLENIWRNYFWDNEYLLQKIKFDKKQQSNYPGVLFGYLDDTLPIIRDYLSTPISNTEECFLSTIGFMQTIYIQQDLTDELLQLFKLSKSRSVDKEPSRTFRNELIGHPISRRKNEASAGQVLKSYALFSYQTQKHKIEYLKYSAVNNYQFEPVEYDTLELIEKHKLFLNKYMDIVFKKAMSILKEWNKAITGLLSLKDKIDFEKLVDLIEIRYNNFFEEDRAYHKDYILICWRDKDRHQRYQFSIDNFKLELSEMITSISSNITQFKNDWQGGSANNGDDFEEPINFDDYVIADKNTVHRNDGYALGKLYENHPIFGIGYFKKQYAGNGEVLAELDNMQDNLGNPEFYCSYNYLRYKLLEDER